MKIPKLFFGCQQTDSKSYMERHKIKNSQHDIEGEQIWRNDTIWFQDLLLSHNNHDSMTLGEKESNRPMK